MPPTIIETVGSELADLPLLELPLFDLLLLEQAAVEPRANAPIAATVMARLNMGVFLSIDALVDQEWVSVPAQMPADSEWLGGRQDSTRFSSSVMRYSAA